MSTFADRSHPERDDRDPDPISPPLPASRPIPVPDEGDVIPPADTVHAHLARARARIAGMVNQPNLHKPPKET